MMRNVTLILPKRNPKVTFTHLASSTQPQFQGPLPPLFSSGEIPLQYKFGILLRVEADFKAAEHKNRWAKDSRSVVSIIFSLSSKVHVVRHPSVSYSTATRTSSAPQLRICIVAWPEDNNERFSKKTQILFLCKSHQFVRNILWDGKFLGLLLLLGLSLPKSSPLRSPLDRLGAIFGTDHWYRTRLRLLPGCRQETRA